MTNCTYFGHRNSPSHRVRSYSVGGHGDVNLCAPNSECRCYWKFRNRAELGQRYNSRPRRSLNGKPRPSYRRTLKSAAEEARLMAPIGPVLESVPLRGTPEWDVRERARAVLGCKCLSFGAL